MKRIIMLFTLLTMAFLSVNAVEVDKMAYTRISDISVKGNTEILDENTCFQYFKSFEECKQIDFNVEYQIWNPNEESIVFSTYDDRMFTLLSEVELEDSGVKAVVVDRSPVTNSPTTHHIPTGIYTETITVSIFHTGNCISLVDGVYRMAIELKTKSVGQVNYAGEVDVSYGIKTYAMENPAEWPEGCPTESAPFPYFALVPVLLGLVLLKKRRS